MVPIGKVTLRALRWPTLLKCNIVKVIALGSVIAASNYTAIGSHMPPTLKA
jgi:hypothetical protein